ncbi:hypothetical protein JOQ06_025230 [Pogonophryne albipinna]|uniref:Uncharacterized protein n=1 Tax=Pogonophryne albipinna TaxID=1090488 RepID=A0AAD6ATY9_9TELE|nr:hypothetical protein JOQ06_025230 [Pogonophryne albipinna]
MSSDIDELKALRADMRQLVDTVRNLQTPSLHGNKPELTVMQPPAPFVGEPNSEDEDDWNAPPPWPDPVSGELLPGNYITPHHPNGRPDELPPKEEVVPAPVTQPSVDQQHVQHSAHGALPATRSWENYADYSTLWYQPAKLSLRPPSLAPNEPKYQVYGGHRSEHSSNPVPPPQPHPHRSWTQPLPSRPALISEPGPTLSNMLM